MASNSCKKLKSDIFVYVDCRLDDSRPFYVGKGSKKRTQVMGRNLLHSRIARKHGFERRIVFETKDNDVACNIEMHLIQILRTRNLYGGANLTDGGEGTLGFNPSPETRHKMSLQKAGKSYQRLIARR